MKILMCDDHEGFLQKLKELLGEILSGMGIRFCLLPFIDPGKALSYITEYADVDVVFMDILLGEKNGYEFAKKIRAISPRSKIIFLSATAEYALKGYALQASCYLVKPLKEAELVSVMESIVKELQYGDGHYIVEKNDSGLYKFYFDEIIYIETSKHNTVIHTTSGNYISYRSMKEHEGQLGNAFFRCHSSYIVNLSFVKNYYKNEVHLLNNEILWVSKGKRKEFLCMLKSFYGEFLK